MRILILIFLAITGVLARPQCANLGSDDCVNSWLPKVSNDDNYLGGAYNPGKRCANLGSDDCVNGWLPGGSDNDDYLGGADNPGKRCANLGTDDCANGWLPGGSDDDDYLGGNDNPGKRNVDLLYYPLRMPDYYKQIILLHQLYSNMHKKQPNVAKHHV